MTFYRTTAAAGDGMDFVISDGSLDRHGTRINPAGWHLDAFRKNPVALFGHDGGFPIGRWHDVRVEGERLIGRLAMAAEGTSARIDEIRKLIEQGILRAVSAGFNVLEFGKPGTEFDFQKQALVEASLVAVPSNINALAQARALNVSTDTLKLVFGEHAEADQARAANGGNAATPQKSKVPKMAETLSQRIEAAQTDLNTARDALTAHLADDASDTAQTETLSGEIEVRETRLVSLKRAEKALAIRQPDNSDTTAEGKRAGLPAPAIRKPLGVKLREPKPEDLFIRAAHVALRAYVTGKDPIAVLEERYGDHEDTQIVTRATMTGATTTVAGWASELVETATDAFLESMRPIAVFPRLAAAGTQLSFGPNRGAIRIPSRAATPSITGSFVGEGAAIPVRKIGLTSITLTPHKMGVISVFTREIARYSNPQIEGLLRQEIQFDTALTIDSLLLDAVAGSASTRPAGLINGVVGLTASTVGGYAAILADIQALAAPFDAANAGRKLVLMMNPREARLVAMAPGPDGTFGWATGFMGEFNVIVSTTVTAGKLVMVDAADFVSVNGSPEFDVSEQTVLHMEDTTPGLDISTATPSQSMFQTASIALRMLLDITWAMRRTGMVTFMTGADWAP
jgi:HK97 family phage major capsid protein/HK97 family phage prohead protease